MVGIGFSRPDSSRNNRVDHVVTMCEIDRVDDANDTTRTDATDP